MSTGQPHAVLMSPVPEGNAGGVERFCWLLAEVLRGQGWRVSIVGPTRQPGRWVFRVGASPLLWSVSTARAVAAADRSAELIVGNGFLGLGVPKGAARVQVFHGTSAAEILAARPSLVRRDFLRRIVSYWPLEARTCRAGRLVVVSDSAARETKRYYRHAATRVIPNGVDTELFKPREMHADQRRDTGPARARLGLSGDTRLALFVGRPEYRKGADLVIEACERAGWKLVHAGSRGIPGAHHLGVLSPEELVDAYAAADCMLFPTRYEACSYAILEALACGTPVVSTRVGWMTTLLEQVPAYDALCVSPNVEDIAARLRWLEAESEQANKTVSETTARAREFVCEHNSIERWQAQWLEVIDEAVQAHAT
ncbi:MAG TPA: glycosyltransferase family 4 protein [Solirubrobacteraceae bacterium]|nr:glycosyltransferase family 4 protein [Solirubrobacteraceae bacterium]